MDYCTSVFLWLIICLFGVLSSLTVVTGDGVRCAFPAIYNFGDSNSDTGGRSASLGEIPLPNGESFFGGPSGRLCDGRLIIDFAAEKLGLPYLSPYLDSIATNFKHGANFATGGSPICPPGYSPFDLGVQINQFLRFKSRTTALYFSGSRKKMKNHLPRPQDFSEALYMIDIGQNDLTYGFVVNNGDEKPVLAFIPDALNTLSAAIKVLYKEGARYFWVHNQGPIGCLPNNIFYEQQRKPGNLDQYGCVGYQNRVVQEFNRQLKLRVSRLHAELPETVFTYVDIYSAKHDLFTRFQDLGLNDPKKPCCGGYQGRYIGCGNKTETVNGKLYGIPCSDPSNFISWDGIHYTQAANLLVAQRVLNGSLSDPPNSIIGACMRKRSCTMNVELISHACDLHVFTEVN